MVKRGGSLQNSLPHSVGGYVMEEVSMTDCLEGGDDGGVSRPREGAGPVGHMGICLFGTADGVPLDDVFRER